MSKKLKLSHRGWRLPRFILKNFVCTGLVNMAWRGTWYSSVLYAFLIIFSVIVGIPRDISSVNLSGLRSIGLSKRNHSYWIYRVLLSWCNTTPCIIGHKTVFHIEKIKASETRTLKTKKWHHVLYIWKIMNRYLNRLIC